MIMAPLTLDKVTDQFARHAALYRHKLATYQTVMLNDLASLWQGRHEHLLDVGGGTGIVAAAMRELLPVGTVTAVDVEDRFLSGLAVETQIYDGETLPFAAETFEAATINNVLHHVPPAVRPRLMAEVRRTVTGPVYIKDHVARSFVDHVRLTLLDLMGNLPFSGMLRARYLGADEWDRLAADAGYRIAARRSSPYRSGVFAWLFPNRLEIAMRLEPID